jgi:hypothetical protein
MRRALLAAVLLSLVVVAPVAAALPNETVAGAIAVSVGTTVTEDTSQADEIDPAETALNEFCGAPVVEHGVWFKITSAADNTVAFDTADSDYAAGIMVFEGTPTPEGLLNCGPEHIVQDLAAGVTYNLLVFGDGESAATGGTLIFKVEQAVPAPDMSLTIDPLGSVNRLGVARITGTVTCTSVDGSGTVFELFGEVTQKVGRLVIRGFLFAFLDLPCDGSTQPWEAFVVGDNGVFAGGKAATVAFAFGCTDVCSEAFAEATVQLRKGGSF